MVRPANPIEYTDVTFNGNKYTIGRVKFVDKFVYFIIDTADKERVQNHNWYVIAREYMGYYVKGEDGKRKSLCMHNFLLGREQFLGRGQDITVDHINGIGFDNRRCNLREIQQSLQNRNTKERTRRVSNLPEGIRHDELPRNIWYMHANGSHGDRFVVEFKGIPDVENLEVKTTSSRFIPTRVKLEEAIRIRRGLLERYPVLVEYSRASERSEQLLHEYDAVISMVPVS